MKGEGVACPRRHWLSLPLACLLAPLPRRGRIAPQPALAERSSPAGKGETKVIFMQGASPLASPGLSPGGTCSPCRCGARRGGEPPAALARPAPGERTISNAEVPLPRSPLSLAAGTANREPLPIVFAANRKLLARGARMAEAVSAANGLMQGCRGRSPLHKKS